MTPETLFLFAPSGEGGSGGMTIFFVQMLAIVAIFYFLIIRPKTQQEKRHRERLEQIKKGDRILTVGGIVGEIVHIKEDEITVKSGESRLVIQRDRVASILSDKSESS
ncbi:MAG TPA: preprotein translocase subunit YajC [Acidimicrobiia bacterium]